MRAGFSISLLKGGREKKMFSWSSNKLSHKASPLPFKF